MKVGIPRELMYVEWVAHLKTLLSYMLPEIEWIHRPIDTGAPNLFLGGDACYPFKTMVRTAVALRAEVDVLLLPRVVSLNGFLMCPNFRALPDIVSLNNKRIEQANKAPILSPVMELSENAHTETLAKITAQQLSAISGQHCSETDSYIPPVPQVPSNRDLSRSIALIGHPYLLADSRLNNGVPEIVRMSGFDIVCAQEVAFKELSELAAAYDYYAKQLYWRPARETLGAFLYFSQHNRPAGIIHLVPFNCGVDALLRIELMILHKRLNTAPPYMVVVCDEHTQKDHVVNRVEAFTDIINGIKIN